MHIIIHGYNNERILSDTKQSNSGRARRSKEIWDKLGRAGSKREEKCLLRSDDGETRSQAE